MEQIKSFAGTHSVFSNFTPVRIEFENMIFGSVEHAFVASKTTNFRLRRVVALIPANKAGKAKRLGRTFQLRSNWEKLREEFMKDFVRQKFKKGLFKEVLLDTGVAEIIEGNYWHDNYWGDCSCESCVDIPGENKLGKILMKVREELINEPTTNPSIG